MFSAASGRSTVVGLEQCRADALAATAINNLLALPAPFKGAPATTVAAASSHGT